MRVVASTVLQVVPRVHAAIIKFFTYIIITHESHWSLCPVMVANSADPLANPVAREVMIHVLRRMSTNTRTWRRFVALLNVH
jgi:hypothetical protein